MSDPLHLDMSSVTIFIPKNCKASGATLAIIYDTYQQEKYTCLECTFSLLPLAIQTTANADIAAANTLTKRKVTMPYEVPRSGTIFS